MNIGFIVIGVFAIVDGMLVFFFTESMLKFGNRWRYRDATPTDEAILVAKIASLISIGLGLAFIFLGIFWESICSIWSFSPPHELGKVEISYSTTKINYD